LPATPIAGNLRFNNTSNKFEGHNGTAWGAIAGGGGGAGTATGIKTADYTAVSGDFVRCDTRLSAFSIKFPALPVDGDIVSVIDVYNSFATNNLTLKPNAVGKYIELDAIGFVVDINGAFLSFVYNSANSNWRMLETPSKLSTTPAPNPTLDFLLINAGII
jgi:hypothetical protein